MSASTQPWLRRLETINQGATNVSCANKPSFQISNDGTRDKFQVPPCPIPWDKSHSYKKAWLHQWKTGMVYTLSAKTVKLQSLKNAAVCPALLCMYIDVEEWKIRLVEIDLRWFETKHHDRAQPLYKIPTSLWVQEARYSLFENHWESTFTSTFNAFVSALSLLSVSCSRRSK